MGSLEGRKEGNLEGRKEGSMYVIGGRESVSEGGNKYGGTFLELLIVGV